MCYNIIMKPKRLVTFKHSLKLSVNEDNLVKNIVEDVKEQIPEAKLKLHKYNIQMILDICNCVENLVKSKSDPKKKVDKKAIVLKVFSDLYDEVDLDIIEKSIDVIFDNKLIKHTKWGKMLWNLVQRVFLR
jgi:hypothetical protein